MTFKKLVILLKMYRNLFFSYLALAAVTAAAKSLQSCPTLYDPIDGSPPGSPVPGILQAGTLEWVAICFSNAWKLKVKVKSLSRVQFFTTPWTAVYHAPPPMGFSRQEYWSGVPLPSPQLSINLLKFSVTWESTHYEWDSCWWWTYKVKLEDSLIVNTHTWLDNPSISIQVKIIFLCYLMQHSKSSQKCSLKSSFLLCPSETLQCLPLPKWDVPRSQWEHHLGFQKFEADFDIGP